MCVCVDVCLSQRERERTGDMVVKRDCGLQRQCLEVFGLILTLDNSESGDLKTVYRVASVRITKTIKVHTGQIPPGTL